MVVLNTNKRQSEKSNHRQQNFFSRKIIAVEKNCNSKKLNK